MVNNQQFKFLLIRKAADKTLVTCGSIIKLKHRAMNCRLHSHQVTYGSGSGQQSVTCFPGTGDSNSYWVVKAAQGQPESSCPPGKPIQHDTKFRLAHANTNSHLHSHLHQSPLSRQQEVSCYSQTDSGDNWIVDLINAGASAKWEQGMPIRLKHVDTGKYLHSHNFKYGHPIPGQFEVTTFDTKDNSENIWIAEGNSSIHTFPDHLLNRGSLLSIHNGDQIKSHNPKNANANQPPIKDSPPMGVIAPNFLFSVNTNVYNDPENNVMPPKNNPPIK